MKSKTPKAVSDIGKSLIEAGFKAYLVGGCVRDILFALQNPAVRDLGGRGREPKDWDVATDAKPEEIQKIFEESVYENAFGTVAVKTGSEDPTLKIVEVTTFRLEGRYTDKRHPDEVKFAKTIEEDLSRRDFTVNAVAFDMASKSEKPVDPYGGEEDLKLKTIRTVGDPNARFEEDALRLMRAVRMAVELGFEIEINTRRAIETNAGLLEAIAKERVRDEFIKILMSSEAARGIILLEELDLLRYIVPELRDGLGMSQNKHHIYTVFEHNVRALDYSAKNNYSLLVRTASLLHDVGKPKVKSGEGPDSTFYNHDIVGAKMTLKILDRLRFPKDFIEKAAHLVRYHLFYYNVGEVTESGVRRFLRRIGPENLDDFIKVREADRIGSGVPKAVPYKLRHLLFMVEKVKNDPISPKMLKVTGTDVMKIMKLEPGPKVGLILSVLLEEVLDDPKKNEKDYLAKRIKELGALPDAELKKMAEAAERKKEGLEGEAEAEIKKKYYVK